MTAEVRFLTRQPGVTWRPWGPTDSPGQTTGIHVQPNTRDHRHCRVQHDGSAKYHNVQLNPNVAFVVDEVTEDCMEGAHFLEVRGVAETTVGTHDLQGHLAPEIIRIHPRRILSFNVDPDHPGFAARDVTPVDLGQRGGLTCWPSKRLVPVTPDVLELRDPPDPIAGPGEVLVAASVCDVLFVDTMICSGRGADYFPSARRSCPATEWRNDCRSRHRRRHQRAWPARGGAYRWSGGQRRLCGSGRGRFRETAPQFSDDTTRSRRPPPSTTAPQHCVSSRRQHRRRGSGYCSRRCRGHGIASRPTACRSRGQGRGCRPWLDETRSCLRRPGPWRQSTTAKPVGPMRCSTPAAALPDRRARRCRRNDRRGGVRADR